LLKADLQNRACGHSIVAKGKGDLFAVPGPVEITRMSQKVFDFGPLVTVIEQSDHLVRRRT